MSRQYSRPVKRMVVKVGSSVIATYRMKPRTARLRSLAEQISGLNKKGLDVILVSSGAIVLGMGELGIRQRPKELSALQALAAIGQTVLMRTYHALFRKQATTCAQVLLTWDDFNSRVRYNNARHTLQALLDSRVIPIINENDTIATDEIKFGDNDRLSALVASMMHADLLLLLSDVEGLYDTKSPDRQVFREIKEITREIEGVASGSANANMSKGGMSAKLTAVKIATQAKIPCIIASGETENVMTRILAGERIGTFFSEQEDKLLARKHWISFGAKPKGVLTVDEGAREALLKGGRSLLLPGVIKWEGDFRVNDIVVVCDQDRQEFARGISNYAVSDLNKMGDKQGQKELIHCNNLVLSKK